MFCKAYSVHKVHYLSKSERKGGVGCGEHGCILQIGMKGREQKQNKPVVKRKVNRTAVFVN